MENDRVDLAEELVLYSIETALCQDSIIEAECERWANAVISSRTTEERKKSHHLFRLWKGARLSHHFIEYPRHAINPCDYSPYQCGLLAQLCLSWSKTSALGAQYERVRGKWLFAATWRSMDTLDETRQHSWVFWIDGTQNIVNFQDQEVGWWRQAATHWRSAVPEEMDMFYRRAMQ